jgi:hypothetical protein
MQTSEYLKEVDGLKKRIDEVCAENTRLINKIIWLETPKDFDLLKANQTIKELTEVRDVLTKALEFGPDQECSACTFGREDGNEECETCRVKRSQYRPKGTCKHV